jgi:hypothetical protein
MTVVCTTSFFLGAIGAKFNNVKIGHARFFDCIPGATFDADPLLTGDEAEVTLVLASNSAEETYRKKNIKKALALLQGSVRSDPQKPLPLDMGERAIIIIFRSLYKSDEIRLDYPEVRKIENSLRGWLREYNLSDDKLGEYIDLFRKLYEDLERTGWICSNPSRTRTKVPCEARTPNVGQIVRSGSIPVHFSTLRELGVEYNQSARRLAN